MPGPLPHFRPEFPGEFVERAKDIVRCHRAERRLWQRARMVVLLNENPQRNHVDIGREVGLSDQAVRKWRKRWCQGDLCLDDKPRSGRAGRRPFPPRDVAEVKVAACETVRETKLPLSKQSTSDLARRLPERIGKPISRSTVFRILDSAAIKPWQHRSWVFPRAVDFAERAAVILDLYASLWDGEPLGPNDYVLSSNEKTSLQARIRCHDSLPVQTGQPQRVESEYVRGGALQCSARSPTGPTLAAWDVHRAKVFGRCEPKTGIAPFGRLVDDVMQQEP